MRVVYRTCPSCGRRFGQPDDPGRKRRFCSDACNQAASRARKRERGQARQRAQDDAKLLERYHRPGVEVVAVAQRPVRPR